MTLIELITMCIKDIGAYNGTLDADEAQDAVNALNVMVDMWNAEGLDVYASTRESKLLTAGTATYTWGTPGGTINTARPVRLLAAYINDTANDYPVDIISEEQYNSIPQKTDTGRPFCLYYNPTYPLGTIYLFYVPDLGSYTLHLDSEKDLATFSTLTAAISLPPEYMAALRWNLGVELCPSYKKPVSPKMEQMAQRSLSIIKRLNASNKLKPVKMNQYPSTTQGGYWKSGDIRSGLPV